MTLYTKKATVWDSEMVRYKRSEGSFHRLFELKHESGRIKVGKVHVFSGLNLRLSIKHWLLGYVRVDGRFADQCSVQMFVFAAESVHRAFFPDN